jgi:hypothetical protein
MLVMAKEKYYKIIRDQKGLNQYYIRIEAKIQ